MRAALTLVLSVLTASGGAGQALSSDGAPAATPGTVAIPPGMVAIPPSARPPAGPSPTNQMALDLGVLGGSLGYARSVRPGRLVGTQVGVGGDFVNYMLVAGRHFAEHNGLSYEAKDGHTDKSLFEMAHVSLFVRHQPSGRWQYDTGVRASVFLHGDSSDDDLGGGWFAGGYATVLYGWRHFKVGPRMLAGMFSEGRPEFGINLAPVTARLVLAW